MTSKAEENDALLAKLFEVTRKEKERKRKWKNFWLVL